MFPNSFLLLTITMVTWVSQIYCDTNYSTFETGDLIYHKNLREKSNQTVLCIDEFGYLHPNTERYLVSKLHQVLHICLNTYGKSVLVFPWDNETLRDTKNRLHSSHLKRPMFQIIENWYVNLMYFTHQRLNEYRRRLHNVTKNYQDCRKQDIKRFWHHDPGSDLFFNQLKKHLRDIIRHHFVNLEKAFYVKNGREMMYTSFMNTTAVPYTRIFNQVFNAKHLVDSQNTVPTKIVSIHVPMFSIPDNVTKGTRTTIITIPTSPRTTVTRPIYQFILNFSPVTFTDSRNRTKFTEHPRGQTKNEEFQG